MNWLDIVIVLTVVSFVAAAYSAGLIREVVTMVAALVGIVVAGLLYDDFAEEVLVFIDDRDVSLALSFLILAGAVYLFGQIVAYVLKKFASLLMLGWADRMGGAFFGLLKSLILVQILLIVFAAYPSLGLEKAIAGSELASYFIDDASVLLVILPGDFEERIDQFLAPPLPAG